MQKTTTINGKRVTARQIIAAEVGETNGGDRVSDIHGAPVTWNYRTGLDELGYDIGGGMSSVCGPERADRIGLCDAGGYGPELAL